MSFLDSLRNFVPKPQVVSPLAKPQTDDKENYFRQLLERISAPKTISETFNPEIQPIVDIQAPPQPPPQPRRLSDTGEFEKVAQPIFEQYGVPPQIGFGQFAAEGRLQGLGASRNNFYNIAAFDSNPDAANSYDTPEAGIEAFARFITGRANNYASPEVQQKFADAYARYQEHQNPELFLLDIQNAGYAGDPNTYPQRAANGYPSYRQFVMDTPEWKKFSQ